MSEPANRYVVSEFYRSYRLDRYIQAMIPKLSRAKIQAAIRTRVSVSWHPRARPALPVVPGGEVVIHFPRIVEPEVTVLPATLYEDDAILVVDKPAGLLVHPTHSCRLSSLIHVLRARRPGESLALAHRLDRDTSGLLLLTKTTQAARVLAGLFERREVRKTYLAVARGRIDPLRGTIDAPLGVSRHLQVIFRRSVGGTGAQPAVTDYTVLARGREMSLVELRPHTGRRHQLRAHLASIGHPIVGDALYGLSDRAYLAKLRSGAPSARHLLHAHTLRFPHPTTAREVFVEAPVPADMRAAIERLDGGERGDAFDSSAADPAASEARA